MAGNAARELNMIISPIATATISVVLLTGYATPGLDHGASVPQQSKPSVNEKSGRLFLADRDDYLKTMRRDLDQLHDQINALMLKANKSGTAMKANLEQKTQGFLEEHKNLEEKWKQAKDVSENQWQEFKLSCNSAMEKLKKSVHTASR